MRDGLTGIDHAVMLVRDLDAAHAAWTRIGFNLTPRGHHTLGSSNHCMMFEHDYLELLAVPVPHPSMRYFTDYLAHAEGLAAFAFSADDGLAAHAAFVRDGIPADPPFEFSRPVERAGGRDARFRIVQLPEVNTPGMRAFVCQQFTPEVVWLPEDVRHPNGAMGIRGIVVACESPRETARAYARLSGVTVRPEQAGSRSEAGKCHGEAVGDSVTVRVGDVDFEFLTVERVTSSLGPAAPVGRTGAHAAAVRVGVADVGAARALLARAGVAFRDGSRGPVVEATRLHGVAVAFEA